MSRGTGTSLERFAALALAFLLGLFGWMIPGSFVEIWEATVCPTTAPGTIWETTCASDQIVVWLIVGTAVAAVIGVLCGRVASVRGDGGDLLLASVLGVVTVVLAFELVLLVLLPSFVAGFAIGYRWLAGRRNLRTGRR